MNTYDGVCVDGPNAGKRITADRYIIRVLRPMPFSETTETTYYYHRLTNGEGIWSIHNDQSRVVLVATSSATGAAGRE